MSDVIQIQLLTDTAIAPKRSENYAAAIDFYADEDTILKEGEHMAISTGVAVHFPKGHYLRLAGRSGLAIKHGIGCLGGVIDHSYTGEIKVILANHTTHTPFEISKGDRICQGILEKISILPVVIVTDLDVVYNNTRQDKGFGSTGK